MMMILHAATAIQWRIGLPFFVSFFSFGAIVAAGVIVVVVEIRSLNELLILA